MSESKYEMNEEDIQNPQYSCNINDFRQPIDRIIFTFTKLCLGDSSNEYSIKKILDVLEDRRFDVFLSVVEDFGLQRPENFVEFISVIKEHCLDKGIHDYATIKQTWKEFVESKANATRKIKELQDAHL